MNFKLALAAAAVVGLAGTAQAADLAKKAPAAADYVKVCDAYGAGFFYIPGTDTCLKIGGYAQAELRTGGHNANMLAQGVGMDLGGNRVSNNLNTRARVHINFDARTNTELGLLRSFIELRATNSSTQTGTNGVDMQKGFIQFAGLTAGRATSMFDFAAGGYVTASMIETDTSDHNVNLFAYTFSFGNGISATVSAEDPTTSDGGTGLMRGPYSAVKMPDVVANIAISQAWGRAQLMGVLHQNYSSVLVAGGADTAKMGYAVGGGVEVNLPMLGATDKVYIQSIYAKGAIGYALTQTGGMAPNALGVATVVPVDFLTNGVSIFQSTAWSVAGGFHHDFTKAVEFNIGGSYAKYTDAVVAAQDFTQYILAGELKWKPVAGLAITPAVEYRNVNFSNASGLADGTQWTGYLRIRRSF